MQTTKTRMTLDEATTNMAALVVDRVHDLIQDGWVKGALTAGFEDAEQFCVHGAMNLALAELFGMRDCPVGRVNVCGGYAAQEFGQAPVEALATAFIVDECQNRYAFKGSWEMGNMAAAPFNDDPAVVHDDVLAVLKGASERLWNVALGTDSTETIVERSWADDVETDSEQAKQFLFARLAA